MRGLLDDYQSKKHDSIAYIIEARKEIMKVVEKIAPVDAQLTQIKRKAAKATTKDMTTLK